MCLPDTSAFVSCERAARLAAVSSLPSARGGLLLGGTSRHPMERGNHVLRRLVWTLGSAFSQILEAFGNLAVNERLGCQGNRPSIRRGFQKVADLHANEHPQVPDPQVQAGRAF